MSYLGSNAYTNRENCKGERVEIQIELVESNSISGIPSSSAWRRSFLIIFSRLSHQPNVQAFALRAFHRANKQSRMFAAVTCAVRSAEVVYES